MVGSKALPGLSKKPGKQNWIEHLPSPMRAAWKKSWIYRAARHLHWTKGMPVGRAIAVAVNAAKKGAATGDLNFPGLQQVNVKSRAEMTAAVALWESMKVASKARTAAKKVTNASEDLSDDASDTNVYTKPKLRDRIKKQLMAGSEGGKPGQWSARKSQLLAQRYEAQGGGYTGRKTDSQKNLQKWSSEDWQTKDGDTRARQSDGSTKRYLPKKAWDSMTDSEKREADRKKRRSKRQFVPNTKRAKTTRRNVTRMSRNDVEARLIDLGMSEVKADLVADELAVQLAAERRTEPSGYWLIFYSKRSTPEVIADGQKPKAYEGYGKETSRRRPNEQELRDIRAGRWLRVREDGKQPGDPGAERSKYRPKLAAKQKTKAQKEAGHGKVSEEARGNRGRSQ